MIAMPQPNSVGACLMTLGMMSLFKPWFFDGSVVYWGEPCLTHSAALEAAEILRSIYQ